MGIVEPVLTYKVGDKPINQMQWSTLQPGWIAIAYANKARILRV